MQFPLRMQVVQVELCSERMSRRFVRRAERTRGLLVLMTMPSSTCVLQAGISRCVPSSSTTQMRQAAISLMSFKKHRWGMGMPASLAALRIVEPSGTERAFPLISMFAIFPHVLP